MQSSPQKLAAVFGSVFSAEDSQWLLYAVSGGIFVALVFCLIFFYRERVNYRKSIEMQEQLTRKYKESLRDQNEQRQLVQNYEQLLMTTATDTYKAIRTVDLETGQSDYLSFDKHHIQRTEVGDWSSWLEMQRKNVHAQDYQKMVDTVSLEKLRTMKEGESASVSYRSAHRGQNGHFKTYTTTVSINRLDVRDLAVMTTIDTSAAVLNEKRQRRILTSAASIYIAMFLLDIPQERFETISSDAQARRLLGGRREGELVMLFAVVYRLTDEQYRDGMKEFFDFSTLDERMKGTQTITFEYPDISRGWCRARFIVVSRDRNSHLTRVLWMVENIDTEKRKANRLLYLSETDLMTGLRNRGSGEKRIKDLLTEGHEGIFCLMDVDKFKSVNDTFGHGVGDKVLIAVADCLKHSFRESDVVLRLGGDEFAIFLDEMTDREKAVSMFGQLFENIGAIDIPELGDRKICISLGAAVLTNDTGWDFETLYRNADLSTYESKKTQGNAYHFYRDIVKKQKPEHA